MARALGEGVSAIIRRVLGSNEGSTTARTHDSAKPATVRSSTGPLTLNRRCLKLLGD